MSPLALWVLVLAATPLDDDAIHPSQFTRVVELREDPIPIGLFETSTRDTEGRWVVSERGEVVFSFDYRTVQDRVTHLGRIDVSGRIISKDTTRSIEIPGYQEIGAPTPAVAQQAEEEEGLVADVVEITEVAREIGSCKQERAETSPYSVMKPMRAGDSSRCGEWHAKWFFKDLFARPDHFSANFERILKHSDALVTPDASLELPSRVLRHVMLIARMGQEVLKERAEASAAIARNLANAERDFEKSQFQLAYQWLKTKNESQRIGFCKPISGLRPTAACEGADLSLFCERLTAALLEACQPSDGGGSTDLSSDEARIVEMLEKRATSRFNQLQLLPPGQLYPQTMAFVERYETFYLEARQAPPPGVGPLEAISPTSYFSAMHSQLRELQKLVQEAAVSQSDPRHLLRKQLKRLRGQGWRDVRLQPKVLGAKHGDIIEVTISYLPAGTTAAPASTSLPTDGQLRPARWIVRLIVNRVGFYVNAGAKLSLAWSHEYAPKAESFRGAQGALVPGVGVDLMYYAGEDGGLPFRMLSFVFGGVGLRLDYLDFDSGQAVELGVGTHLQLFKGIISFGVGYNFGIPNPRFTFRELYWSFGLGVEQVFDLAKDLAANYQR